MPEQENEAELELFRMLHAVASRKGKSLGISATEYLIGILEGQFPFITMKELLAREKCERPEWISPRRFRHVRRAAKHGRRR